MEVRPGCKLTKVGVIPDDWSVKHLSAFADVKTGPFGSALHESDYVSDGTPIITVEHLSEQGVVHENLPLVSEVDRNRLSSYSLRTGDIVFSRVGSIDRSALISNSEDGWLFSGRLLRVRLLSTDVHAPYLSYHFCSEPFKQRVRTVAVGQTMASLSTQILKGICAVLPAPSEQRVIAAALSDVDALLEGLDQLITKKRDLKQAAMQQLLTGQTRLPGFRGEWQSKSLGDVVETDPESLGSDTSGDFAFKYIALEDVERGLLRSHSERVFAKAPSRARRKLRPSDILVSTVRPNLQSHLLFSGHDGDWVCSTGFCVVRCREAIAHPSFIFSQLFTDGVTRQIDALITGSNYPAINSGDVRSLMIPFPDFDEQAAIATVLSDIDAEIAALNARRDKTRSLKQAMMQELLIGKTRLLEPEVAHA